MRRRLTRPIALLLFSVGVLLLVRGLLPETARATAGTDGGGTPARSGRPQLNGAKGGPIPPPAAPSPARPPWNDSIQRLVARWKDEAVRRSPRVHSADEITVTVCVRQLRSKRELCALGAERALAPASNMKLITTAAALVLGGADMEFVTAFDADGARHDGRLAGDLIVRAGGDPLVKRGPAIPVEEPLRAVARRLAQDGLRLVQGNLVLDEGDFRTPAPAAGWPDASQHWAAYCALAGGLSVNGGVIDAAVVPGEPGEPAVVRVEPANHGLERRYAVQTIGKGRLDVRVGATRAGVTVRGEIPHTVGTYAASFAHFDPVELFGEVLLHELRAAGITIEGRIVRERNVPLADGGTLATLHSPLVQVLAPINAESENGVADQVFFTLGHLFGGAGSRAGGETATRLALERLGVSTEGFVQADGSGLSRDNRASARQIVSLLQAVFIQGGEAARLYRASLASPGGQGTLENRLLGGPAETRVFAKTGWITGASALSGFAETLSGEPLAFSILVSYPRTAGGLNTSCFKPMQDEIVQALVGGQP